MPNSIRIALCQLECHPAFFIDKFAFLEEPFVPKNINNSLSSLSTDGLPGILELKTTNKNQYIDWHLDRLKEILSHPLLNDKEIPCLLAFPEGAIPFNALPTLADFAKKTDAIVIGGTHSIQNIMEARKIYKAFGKERVILKRKETLGQVSFIFSGSTVYTRSKQIPSIFEVTDTSSLPKEQEKIHPYRSQIKETLIKFIPLVCAEALQTPNIIGDFDLLNIISYAPNPDYFSPYIDSQVQRSKICTFLNDGKFGESYIKFPLDRRSASWFFSAPLYGKLPVGDALLIVDVSIDQIAPKVGVVNPDTNYKIKLLSSITYKQSSKLNQNVSIELREIAGIDQPEVRKSRLSKLLKTGLADTNQKARIEYLEELSRNGIDQDEHWNCYGHDIIINQPGLQDIEANLSQNCYTCLSPLLMENGFDQETEINLKAFLKACNKRSQLLKDTTNFECKTETEAVSKEDTINRDWECRRILSFFDSREQIGIQITGLLNIGKTSTISKALRQTGFRRINKIEVAKSSTIQFLFEKLIGNPWYETIPEDIEIFNLLTDEKTIKTIHEWDLIWFESCEFLLTKGNWRSDEIGQFFNALLTLLKKGNTKIIFESTYELQFDLEDPSLIGKLRIKGFEGRGLEHGIALFNKQLRRLDFSPSDLEESEKGKLIKKMGGHPLAIVYCADAIYENGFSSVLKAVEKGDGFYKKLINKILQHVNLTEEQTLILRLLEGSNIDIHRDLLSSVCDFPVSDHISNLIKQCLIEISSPDTIKLPGVLKSKFKFRHLSEDIKKNFHKEASKFYGFLIKKNPLKIEYAIAAELHANFSGEKSPVSSGFIDSKIAQAHTLFDDRKFQEAKRIIEKTLKIKQTRDILRLSLLIDAELGLHESVIEKAKTIFSQNPDDSYLFQRLTKIALTQNRADKAEELVTIAQGNNINETSIFIVQGDIARRRKQLDHAEWYYREAINSDYRRSNVWPYFFLGLILIKVGDIDDAIDILYDGLTIIEEKHISNSNVKNAITTQLCIAYILNGDIDAAEPMIENLIEYSPENPEIVNVYAYLIVKRDGKKKAEEAYQKFKKVRPRTWKQKSHYHLFYALFLLELDKIAEANDHFALAHKYEENNVYIMVKYSETLYIMAKNAKNDSDYISEEYAKKCAQIIKKILDFNEDNSIANKLRVDLNYEFEINLSEFSNS